MARKTFDQVPAVVALARGDVHNEVIKRLQRIIGALHLDPNLDLAASLGVLMACASDLLLRLDIYMQFPFLLALLCRAWSPTTYITACVLFVRADPLLLDEGCSLPFQEIALAESEGDELEAVNWLASDAVQEFLVEVSNVMLLNSFDAERGAAVAKHLVARKVPNYDYCY